MIRSTVCTCKRQQWPCHPEASLHDPHLADFFCYTGWSPRHYPCMVFFRTGSMWRFGHHKLYTNQTGQRIFTHSQIDQRGPRGTSMGH